MEFVIKSTKKLAYFYPQQDKEMWEKGFITLHTEDMVMAFHKMEELIPTLVFPPRNGGE